MRARPSFLATLWQPKMQRERLALPFSMGDFDVFGVRLGHVLNRLDDQKLAAVWPLAEQYANLEPSQPCVTGITVRLLDNKPGK